MEISSEIPINISTAEKLVVPRALTWEDLMTFSERGYGLRHCSDKDAAIKQMKEGVVYGDAVSIASPMSFVPETAFQNPDIAKLLPFFRIAGLIPGEYRDQIVTKFETAVIGFLTESIGLDINSLSKNLSTDELINELVNTKAGFVIGEFDGARNPYDVADYFNLGKCGKQNVSPEKMVCQVDLTDKIEMVKAELNFSNDDLNTQLTLDKFNRIKNFLGKAIFLELTDKLSKVEDDHSSFPNKEAL